MSTQINVTVDSGGLSDADNNQRNAMRWSKAESDNRTKVQNQGRDQRDKARAQQGLDANGKPKPTAQAPQLRKDEPAANRLVEALRLFVLPEETYALSTANPSNADWELQPTSALPLTTARAYPMVQVGGRPKFDFIQHAAKLYENSNYTDPRAVVNYVSVNNGAFTSSTNWYEIPPNPSTGFDASGAGIFRASAGPIDVRGKKKSYSIKYDIFLGPHTPTSALPYPGNSITRPSSHSSSFQISLQLQRKTGGAYETIEYQTVASTTGRSQVSGTSVPGTEYVTIAPGMSVSRNEAGDVSDVLNMLGKWYSVTYEFSSAGTIVKVDGVVTSQTAASQASIDALRDASRASIFVTIFTGHQAGLSEDKGPLPSVVKVRNLEWILK